MTSILDQYDRAAYEPMYGRDEDGKKVLIGVQRRLQPEIDRRRAARAVAEQAEEPRPLSDRMKVGE